jgi:hypothetical protein
MKAKLTFATLSILLASSSAIRPAAAIDIQSIARDAARNAVQSATQNAVRSATQSAVHSATQSAVHSATQSAVHSAVNSATRNAIQQRPPAVAPKVNIANAPKAGAPMPNSQNGASKLNSATTTSSTKVVPSKQAIKADQSGATAINEGSNGTGVANGSTSSGSSNKGATAIAPASTPPSSASAPPGFHDGLQQPDGSGGVITYYNQNGHWTAVDCFSGTCAPPIPISFQQLPNGVWQWTASNGIQTLSGTIGTPGNPATVLNSGGAPSSGNRQIIYNDAGLPSYWRTVPDDVLAIYGPLSEASSLPTNTGQPAPAALPIDGGSGRLNDGNGGILGPQNQFGNPTAAPVAGGSNDGQQFSQLYTPGSTNDPNCLAGCYDPRLLNDIGIEPQYPDGTLAPPAVDTGGGLSMEQLQARVDQNKQLVAQQMLADATAPITPIQTPGSFGSIISVGGCLGGSKSCYGVAATYDSTGITVYYTDPNNSGGSPQVNFTAQLAVNPQAVAQGESITVSTSPATAATFSSGGVAWGASIGPPGFSQTTGVRWGHWSITP